MVMTKNVLEKLREQITPQTKVERKKELFFIFDTLETTGKITKEDYESCIETIRLKYK